MSDRRLMQSQKNEVLTLIKAAGFEPTEFNWEDWKSSDAQFSKLIHTPSHSYLSFGYNQQYLFTLEYSPGAAKREESRVIASWPETKQVVANWLSYLRREVDSPDFWEIVEQEKTLLRSAPASDEDNAPFTPEEKLKVLAGLKEIEQYLLEAHRLDPQLVSGQMKYLAGATDRVPKIDWRQIFAASIIQIIMEGSLTGDNARAVFRFAWNIMKPVFQSTGLLPA